MSCSSAPHPTAGGRGPDSHTQLGDPRAGGEGPGDIVGDAFVVWRAMFPMAFAAASLGIAVPNLLIVLANGWFDAGPQIFSERFGTITNLATTAAIAGPIREVGIGHTLVRAAVASVATGLSLTIVGSVLAVLYIEDRAA